MEFTASHCKKCQEVTKHYMNDQICHKCGHKKEQGGTIDFIKTQETELDLLK